ncbi:MAG: alpha/beta hydrolase-fold protein, partial [Owenweeksia sp.]
EIIPAKQGPVKGILVKVNSEYTLRPYRLSDLEFTFERNPPFEKQTFTYNGNTLPYQVMFPRAYDPNGSYPLVVFLHGAGERGTNNTSQMAYGPNTFGSYEARSDYPAIVIFPQCPSDVMWSRRAKYDQNGQLIFQFPVEQDPNYAMNMVIELVRDFVANEAVDDKRIYVSGLSMGGIGTFEFCYYAPDLPAAAISIAGGHDSSFVSGYATNIDFRLYHGGKDGVVPPRYSQEMHTALQQGGFSSEYFEAPNRGHEWNYVLNDPDYIQWMFNQSR